MPEFTHLDESGAARMVETSAKPETLRRAKASGQVRMTPETWQAILDKQVVKGNVCDVARVAGIMAAKQTGQLIPLCHPLPLTGVTVDFTFPAPGVIRIEAEATVVGRTGVEMEAMTAVTVAGLTIYDMCKALDRSMTIGLIRLETKSGGRSGNWQRPAEDLGSS